MPDATSPRIPLTADELRTRLASRWRSFVLLGVGLLLLGALGLSMVGTLTLATILWFGVLFLVGGAVQLWQATKAQGWRSMAIAAAIGMLYLVAGALVVAHPVIGAETLTVALGVVILGVGAARMLIAFQHRSDPGWVWTCAAGAVGVVLGFLILASVHEGAPWILGLFVAIELMSQGVAMVLMGLTLRRWRRGLTTA